MVTIPQVDISFESFFGQVFWADWLAGWWAHGDSQSAFLGVSCECTLVLSVVMAVYVGAGSGLV